ncbi:MAG: DUF4476 domain-containing protein [Pseudobacter sp.]|uniref:DUF4476 domain-containing protein n=1 Tax=Pseudobacter sp. TaxID=2045420 RepID=UPI003F7D6A61
MNVKFILGLLLFFASPLLAQESFPLIIRTEDKSKFYVYVNDVAQTAQPVSTIRFVIRSGKSVIKIAFQNPAFAPLVQELVTSRPLQPLTLRKRNRQYLLEGLPDFNDRRDRACCERCDSRNGGCCSDNVGRPPRGNDPRDGGYPIPPNRGEYLPNRTVCQAPTLSEMAFVTLKKKISDEYYSYGKAKVAMQAMDNHCVTASQVAGMVKMIADYSSDQFEVAKYGYLHMYNTEDYDLVINAVASKDHQYNLRAFAVAAGPRQPRPDNPGWPGGQQPGPSFPRCEQVNCRGFAFSDKELDQALGVIRSSTFEDTKFEQAKLIARNNCLTVAQVRSIVGLMSFEKSKLDFAKYAYSVSHDKRNFYLVNQEFTFDASKSELTDYMKRN